MTAHIQLATRPRLSVAARLRFDTPSQSYVLLSPERGLRLNESASEVVRRCNGTLSVEQLIEQLRSTYIVEAKTTTAHLTAEQIRAEVIELLAALHQRRLVVFEPAL